MIDIATGKAEDDFAPPVKNPAAVALGKLGGKKGGRARADAMSPQRRSEIAQLAAKARWRREQQNDH